MILVNIGLFFLVFIGGMMIFASLLPQASPSAVRAVAARSGKKETLTVTLVNRIAVRLLPLISIEDMKRQKLGQTLAVLGNPASPELFQARAWATGAVYFVGVFALLPVIHLALIVLSPDMLSALTIYQLGIVVAVIMLFTGKNAVISELDKEIRKRQEAIEWELPQFSGTILHCLGHTRNVPEILGSYKKICGDALRHEIERTLNDMNTGNHEKAIKNLAARVNSGAFTQLATGLIGLLRGNDQTNYFQIITNDFYHAQSEMITKEILKRPDKLTINNILLLAGMIAMFLVSIGGYLMDAGAGLF